MEDSLIEPEEQVFIGTVYMQGQMLQETDGNSLIIYFVYYLPAGVRRVNNRVRFSASMELYSSVRNIQIPFLSSRHLQFIYGNMTFYIKKV